MNKRIVLIGLAVLAALSLVGCSTVVSAASEEPVPEGDDPVQITGTIEISNDLIVEIYFAENFVLLEDLHGFVNREFDFEQPVESQIIGPVVVNEDGEYTFTLNLPAYPNSLYNDVDNDGEEDTGVQVWQVVMSANQIGTPFLDGFDIWVKESWSMAYTSAHINSENEDEIDGGTIIVWAPDDEQDFPTGFGDDGLLFTDDDPVDKLPAGYSLVYLDSEPFEIYKENYPELLLLEGDVAVNDLSDLGWVEGFGALYAQASTEYPFTELKEVDWEAIYEEIAPRIEEAEANADPVSYFLALQDFAFSIPDGHVYLGGEDFDLIAEDVSGGYGFGMIDLSDGRTIAHVLVEDGPAAQAGMEWGAEILEWGGTPISERIEDVVVWSGPFSNPELERLQYLRFLSHDPLGTEVDITFQNPGADEPETVTLKAALDGSTLGLTSAFADYDPYALPVEYEILPSGYGYLAINSLSDDLNLTVRLWEWAVQAMSDAGVPGVIIDLRQNGGGAPIGSFLASYFTDQPLDLSLNYYYSDETGELETFRPPDSIEPNPDWYYDGDVIVLVSHACASACENVAWVFDQLPQTTVYGYYSTMGIYGEVGRGQYNLPGDYFFQIPTGLSTDMDGNIIIEGPGVVPDVRVPLDEDTAYRQYIEGEDVLLNAAIEGLGG